MDLFCCLLLDIYHSLSTRCVWIRLDQKQETIQVKSPGNQWCLQGPGREGDCQSQNKLSLNTKASVYNPTPWFLRRKMVNSRSTWLHTETLCQSQTPVKFPVPGLRKAVKPEGRGETVLTHAYLTWPKCLLTLSLHGFCFCLCQTQWCFRDVHTKSWLLDVHSVLWRAQLFAGEFPYRQ